MFSPSVRPTSGPGRGAAPPPPRQPGWRRRPVPPPRRQAPPGSVRSPSATPHGKPLHCTERTTYVTVHYRWHPLYGQMARVNRSVPSDSGAWLFCELPDGTRGTLPAWMTDAGACAVLTLGAPMVAIPALQEVRVLLDALARGSDRTDRTEVSMPFKEGCDASKESVETDPPDMAIPAGRRRARPPGRADRSTATGADPRVGRTPAARRGRRGHRGPDGRA